MKDISQRLCEKVLAADALFSFLKQRAFYGQKRVRNNLGIQGIDTVDIYFYLWMLIFFQAIKLIKNKKLGQIHA